MILGGFFIVSFFISAGSRGSDNAQLYRSSINYIANWHQTLIVEAFESIAKSIPKRRRIDEQTSLKRWRRRNAICWGLSQAPEPTAEIQGFYFPSIAKWGVVKWGGEDLPQSRSNG